MSWFTKQVTVLNHELDSLEMLVHHIGMSMGELQRMQVEVGENIQVADDVLAKALRFISNAEDSLNLASAYISKFNQYYKLEDAQNGRAMCYEDDTSTTLSSSCRVLGVARVSDLEKRLRIRRIRRVR